MSSSNVHLVTASNVFSVNDIGIPLIFHGHVIYLPLSSTKCGYFWSKQSHHRRKITKEEEGWYTCKAKNAAGFSTKDIEISVKGVFVKLTTVF